ncbi:hypothetical protein TNCV_4020291 [Trichonephila clavipes]|nr:hypothetical protein TNCV_4020291 [Trichonephila clavipes]
MEFNYGINPQVLSGCGSLVVKVSDRGWLVTSSSPILRKDPPCPPVQYSDAEFGAAGSGFESRVRHGFSSCNPSLRCDMHFTLVYVSAVPGFARSPAHCLLVGLRGGWRHARMKFLTRIYGSNAAVPGSCSSTQENLRPFPSVIIQTIQSESLLKIPSPITTTTTSPGNNLNTSVSSLETETRSLTTPS